MYTDFALIRIIIYLTLLIFSIVNIVVQLIHCSLMNMKSLILF